MTRTLLIFLLIWQITLSAFAQLPQPSPQQKPDPTPSQTEPQQPIKQGDEDVVRITTNLVQVDPVITDKNGRQVTDLRQDEVQILEDGKPQKITNFSYISLELAAPPGSAPPGSPLPAKPIDKNSPPVPPVNLRPEQVRRTMALVVDDLGLSFESAYYVRNALKKFINQQMQPNDLVAIIRTGAGIGALQQFTSDKRQLFAAADKVKWNPTGRGGSAAFAPIGGASVESPADPDRTIAPREDVDQFREDLFTVGTLGAVNYIVKGLRELPGRKSVVLISDGIKIFSRGNPYSNLRILTALRQLTDLANRASVVIYTMDARGLQTLGLTAADSTSGLTADQVEQRLSDRRTDFFEGQNGLNYLAQQTGGLSIRNTNDLNAGIQRVVDDQKGYYLVGYRPDESTFEEVSGRRKFHKLSFKVTRPGKYNVRMRNGFYGITDAEAVPGRLTPAQQLIGALTSPFGSAGVHLRLSTLFANDPQLGSVMRSLLHVNARDLTFTAEPDGWHKSIFDVIAITFGDNGVVVDQLSRTHTMRVRGPAYERILKDGFTYNVIVPIKKPGAYQFRTALRDSASERTGSATQFIEVPDVKKNRLTLSGLLIAGVPLETFKKAQQAPTNQGQSNDNSTDEIEANTATRQFERGFVMYHRFAIYNAQLDKTTGKPQVITQTRIFRDGQQIFAGKEIPFDVSDQPDLKRLMAGGAIQLGQDMTPGEYVLQVVVTDLLAKQKYRMTTQWIDFEIVK
ncbi:MAG: VWA domain-containing protein [Pyrinomonadaceae bacterium]